MSNVVPNVNSVTISDNERKPLTAEQKAEANKREKLHFWLFAVVERLQKNELSQTPNEAKFVRDGKAEIQIRLTAKSPEIIERLKNAGFEIVDDKRAKIIVGRIAIEKLAALAEITEVEYVLPNVK